MGALIAVLLAVIIAAIVYFVLAALGLPYIVCLLAALLIILVGLWHAFAGYRGVP